MRSTSVFHVHPFLRNQKALEKIRCCDMLWFGKDPMTVPEKALRKLLRIIPKKEATIESVLWLSKLDRVQSRARERETQSHREQETEKVVGALQGSWLLDRILPSTLRLTQMLETKTSIRLWGLERRAA